MAEVAIYVCVYLRANNLHNAAEDICDPKPRLCAAARNLAAGAADNDDDDALKFPATLLRLYPLNNLILPLAHRLSAQNSTRRKSLEQSRF